MQTSRIALFAVKCRISILLLQCLANNCIPDHLADATHLEKNASLSSSWIDATLLFLLDGFQKWDAVHYTHIAAHGYNHPRLLAFQPLLPWLLRQFDLWAISPIFGNLVHTYTRILLIGTTFNISAFAISAILLYKLSYKVLQNQILAIVSVTMYCINPASIFMSSLYTESLYACCSFGGMLCWQYPTNLTGYLLGTLAFTLAVAVRSNGMVLIGFVGYTLLLYRLKTASSGRLFLFEIIYYACQTIVLLLPFAIAILSPFYMFQSYGMRKFCNSSHQVEPLPWCNKDLSIPYWEVQRKYWNVGFLRYYQLKQIPNFILAAPMVTLCIFAIRKYLHCWNSLYASFLGSFHQTRASSQLPITFGNPAMFVYIIHVLFLTIFGLTSMHVQVITRLIASSSPVIYWFTAYSIIQGIKHRSKDPSEMNYADWLQNWDNFESIRRIYLSNKLDFTGRLAVIYFLTYSIIGTVVHSNFYPWT
ncbi:GPI mannosyltransferase 2 [Trichoplax sp. H2]|nr:GPI mannosyltransferase 2 [Trichoplax sp. H2]|eukprot:RDD45016.1 GPI mannosyltransferase 2 [Trichoplax sp. H2]